MAEVVLGLFKIGITIGNKRRTRQKHIYILLSPFLSKYHDFLLVLKHKNVPFQPQNADRIDERPPIQANE